MAPQPPPQNIAAPSAPYYTPAQQPPAGTALSSSSSLPTLFTPLRIHNTTFPNRIFVAPMCMYSCRDGHLTDFHLVHLGAFALRGAALTMIEATSVRAVGRITPEDSGLWEDAQIVGVKRIVDFVHSQGQKVGIQLAHAGRKASTIAPWLVPTRGASILATEEVYGWPSEVLGPSAIRWGEGYADPKEMSVEDIKDVVEGFREAAKRAITAGVDVIEIHAAHGYLLCSFLSPLSNQRTDEYGGSFENRTRMLVETVRAVREVIPADMPLFLRVSATEWMESEVEESWDVEQTLRLAKMLPGLGVDLLDVSSGGNNRAQKITPFNDFQVGIAGQIRAALRADGIKLLVGAVGMITEAEAAKSIVEEKEGDVENLVTARPAQGHDDVTIEIEDEHGQVAKADVVLVARQFLREPEWVFRVAYRLGVPIRWPNQYHRGTFLKGSKI